MSDPKFDAIRNAWAKFNFDLTTESCDAMKAKIDAAEAAYIARGIELCEHEKNVRRGNELREPPPFQCCKCGGRFLLRNKREDEGCPWCLLDEARARIAELIEKRRADAVTIRGLRGKIADLERSRENSRPRV